MRQKILIIFTFLIFTHECISQDKCGENIPLFDSISTIPILSRSQPPISNATIRLYFHVVRKKNGSGGNVISISELTNAFNELNPIYNQVNICFLFAGYDYINDNDFYDSFDFSESKISDLFNTNFVNNSINVYVVPKDNNAEGEKYLGRSLLIPNVACVLTKAALLDNRNTLAHELGHDLGLYHTFETINGVELLNGANCGNAGDQVCDTPADNPTEQTHSNCSYSGGGGFNPLTNNIMSNYNGCEIQFTAGQGIRMRSSISNYPDLFANKLTNDFLTISNTTYPLIIGSPLCNNPIPPSYCPDPIFSLLEIGKLKISTSGSVIINPYNPYNNPFNYTTTIGFISEQEIELLPGFEANEGVKFAAVLSPACPASVNFRTNNSDDKNNFYEIFYDGNINNENYDNSKELSTEGILNKDSKTSFILIPNPNNGNFKVIFNSNSELPHLISLLDSQGKVISRIENPIQNEYDFSLIDLNAGLFLLNANYKDKIISQKFIKQ